MQKIWSLPVQSFRFSFLPALYLWTADSHNYGNFHQHDFLKISHQGWIVQFDLHNHPPDSSPSIPTHIFLLDISQGIDKGLWSAVWKPDNCYLADIHSEYNIHHCFSFSSRLILFIHNICDPSALDIPVLLCKRKISLEFIQWMSSITLTLHLLHDKHSYWWLKRYIILGASWSIRN